jgi:hypothetical protein
MRSSFLAIVAVSILPLRAVAQVDYTVVAHSDQPVPQTNGLLSYSFSLPVLNRYGQVATNLYYDRSSLKQALTLFPTPGEYNPIAFQGNPAPGADDGAPFGAGFTGISLNSIGQVTFKNYIGSNIAKDEALFTTPSPLSDIAISMFLTAREGYAAPGLPAGTVYTRVGAENATFSSPLLGNGGQVAFTAGLSGAGTTAGTAHALFAGSPGAPTLVLREGDPTPYNGFNFGVPSNLNINPAGQIAFRSSLHSGANLFPNGGIYLATPKADWSGYTVAKVANLRESPTPSPLYHAYTSFSAPSLNAAGDVAFVGQVDSSTGSQYLMLGKPGKLAIVAHSGEPLVTDNGLTLTPTRIGDPLLSTNGAVTFGATLVDDASRDTALISGLPGHLKVIAREGDPTPAGADTFFGSLVPSGTAPKVSVNGHGQVAFAASMTGPGATPATSQALFATDRAGQLMLVARYGQTFDTEKGPRTAGSFYSVYLSNGSDGLPSSFNDLGQLVFTLVADSGTPSEYSALIRAQIPFPGDANADGRVDTTDFKALYKHFNKPGGQADGDFNHDGMVSFGDFQLLENWFGKSVTDAPVNISASDVAALNAFASTAPEPPLLIPLMTALLFVRPRRNGLRDALLTRTRRALH